MQFVDRTMKRTSFQLVCRDLSIKIYTFTVACIFVRKKQKEQWGTLCGRIGTKKDRCIRAVLANKKSRSECFRDR